MTTDINQKPVSGQYPKKRVLFVITQSEYGGAQRFLHTLVSHLDPAKYDVTIATGAEGKNNIFSSSEQKNVKFLILRNLIRDVSPLNDLKALEEFKNLLLGVRPEVLFLLSSKAGFIGSWAAKSSRAPMRVIYRIGGWTFNDPWPAWKKTLFLYMEKFSAGWKDTIIVNNEYDLKQAQRKGIKPRGQLELVHNGLDVYKMDFLSKEEARDRLSCKTKTVIGTIANFYPAKGLEFFIETASFFKNRNDVSFVIIGDGKERKKLEKSIKEKGLSEKIFLPGQLSDARRYLAAFDIFYLSSLKEGFPWALLEAMAAKLPVVATDVGAVPEIIQNGKNGLIIPPRRPEIAAEAIKTVLNGPKLAQELGIQAHQTVLFKFSLDKMMEQIEALF